jgi:hypothetical protein
MASRHPANVIYALISVSGARTFSLAASRNASAAWRFRKLRPPAPCALV